MAKFRLFCAGASDVGKHRAANEDAILLLREEGVFSVADGMGGAAGGQFASGEVVAAISRCLFGGGPPRDLAAKASAVRDAVQKASRSILRWAEGEGFKGCGTTLVTLLLDLAMRQEALVLHAGDSRVYVCRRGTLKQLTRDHSVASILKGRAAAASLFDNVVTRAVGLRETVDLEETTFMYEDGDLFLLCSDGLTKAVPEDQILRGLRGARVTALEEAARALVRAANDAGGQDNVSISREEPVIKIRKEFWAKLARYALKEAASQNDPMYLAVARRCLFETLPLYARAGREWTDEEKCQAALTNFQEQVPEVVVRNYLPINETTHFIVQHLPSGGYAPCPFLETFLHQPAGQGRYARILPPRMNLVLQAREGGKVAGKQAFSMPFVLVPDGALDGSATPGNRNAGYVSPFYLAATETPLEAMRCYRDDARRGDGRFTNAYTGIVQGNTSGQPEAPYAEATSAEAMEFCNWLSVRDGLQPVYVLKDGAWSADLLKSGFRLPTVAEWSYAARFGAEAAAGGETRRSEEEEAICYGGGAKLPRLPRLNLASPLGLCEMSGNVWEICVDDATPLDPVLQGGSAASRIKEEVTPGSPKSVKHGWEHDKTIKHIGFRVMRPVPVQHY